MWSIGIMYEFYCEITLNIWIGILILSLLFHIWKHLVLDIGNLISYMHNFKWDITFHICMILALTSYEFYFIIIWSNMKPSELSAYHGFNLWLEEKCVRPGTSEYPMTTCELRSSVAILGILSQDLGIFEAVGIFLGFFLQIFGLGIFLGFIPNYWRPNLGWKWPSLEKWSMP